MKSILAFTVLMGSVAAMAHEKPADVPACSSLAQQCEKAGYEPGDHKKNGKGLWADCVGAIAKGKTVAGVTASQSDAKACQEAAKAQRAENKAEKKK